MIKVYCYSVESQLKDGRERIMLARLGLKGNGYTSEDDISIRFCFPSEKGSTLKGKNLLPLGANSFLLELNPFQKGLGK